MPHPPGFTPIDPATLAAIMEQLRQGQSFTRICRGLHLGEDRVGRALHQAYGDEYEALRAPKRQPPRRK